MSYKNIQLNIDGAIATVAVDRPKVYNALDMDTLAELESAFHAIDKDCNVRATILTGTGEKAFVSGADIAAMLEMSSSDAARFAQAGHNLMKAIEGSKRPVIAAVNGFALGGGTELSLACDIIYAADSAKFGLPEVKLGVYPGFGGTQRLPRLIGLSRARELIFTGRVISAKDAFDLGIVNRVMPAAELMTETKKLALEIAANGPVAVSLAKRLVNSGAGLPFDKALENERSSFKDIFESSEHIEGMKAFLEKRKPNFE